MGHDQGALLGTQAPALLEDALRHVELAQVLEQGRVADPPLPRHIEAEIFGESLSQLCVLFRPTVHRLAELDRAGMRKLGGLLYLPPLVEKSRRLQGRR